MGKKAAQFALPKISLSYLQGSTIGPCPKPQESTHIFPSWY